MSSKAFWGEGSAGQARGSRRRNPGRRSASPPLPLLLPVARRRAEAAALCLGVLQHLPHAPQNWRQPRPARGHRSGSLTSAASGPRSPHLLPSVSGQLALGEEPDGSLSGHRFVPQLLLRPRFWGAQQDQRQNRQSPSEAVGHGEAESGSLLWGGGKRGREGAGSAQLLLKRNAGGCPATLLFGCSPLLSTRPTRPLRAHYHAFHIKTMTMLIYSKF